MKLELMLEQLLTPLIPLALILLTPMLQGQMVRQPLIPPPLQRLRQRQPLMMNFALIR